MKTSYAVTGMTCSHCEKAVSEEVSAVAGVSAVEVSASEGSLLVTSETAVDDAAVLAAVAEAGYTATRSIATITEESP